MNRYRFYRGILVLFLVLIGLWMIQKEQDRRQESERYMVSVIVSDSNNDRWIAMKQGMEQAAGDFHIDLNIISTGPFATLEEELEVVRREVSNNVDGVILQMVSSEQAYEALEGIFTKEAVIFLETDIEPEEYFVSVVPDNIGMGAALADCILKDYGERIEGKKIGILGGNQKQISMQQRLSGFTKQMEGSNAEITWVLHSESEEQIEKEEMLTLVDLLVALDNAETEQAVDYLLEVPQEAKRCALYGEGISEKVVYYLDRGLIQSLVVPNEFHMGYQSVKEMSRQLSYSPTIGESSQVGFLVVDKENLYKTDNQKILFPIVQ